jgi:hypothetical protein
MRIDSAFPSSYLKAADLQGRTVSVVMDRVAMEEIGSGEHKPVLYFVGKEKGMVLNKTNSNNIAAAYGYETEAWAGQKIELFPTMVDFQGKSVEAIRCRPPRGATPHPYAPPNYDQQRNGNGATTSTPQQAQSRQELNDEIPF